MTDSVLSALDLTAEDKIIVIKEQKLADSSFILSSIMSQAFANKNNVCLVILHNTIGHYHNVGKRLGFDLLNQIKEGHAKTVEPLKDICNDFLSQNRRYLSDIKEEIVKQLFLQIRTLTNELLQNNKQTTIILDDVSHLSDLGVDLKYIITFLKYCIGLTIKNNICLVVNCHEVSNFEIISNTLFHSADLAITVSALKTGRSKKVSGVFSVNRKRISQNPVTRQSIYHYKLFDKEIRTFAPGRALI